jgi:hypothetical protein
MVHYSLFSASGFRFSRCLSYDGLGLKWLKIHSCFQFRVELYLDNKGHACFQNVGNELNRYLICCFAVEVLLTHHNSESYPNILFYFRCLTGNCSALVEISVSRPLPLELYKDNRELGKWTHSVRKN